MASAFLPQHDGLLPYFLIYVSEDRQSHFGIRLTNVTSVKAGVSAMIHSFVMPKISHL